MVNLVYSPVWFYGHDIIIDLVSALVLCLVALFSLKYYKINKNKNYLWLAVSFLFLAFSFFFKILTNFAVHYGLLAKIGLDPGLSGTDFTLYLGLLIYRLFAIVGLYLLYGTYQKHHSKTDMIFILTLIILSIYLSRSAYYIFHVMSLLLLIFITTIYFRRYKVIKQKAAGMLACSFLVITLSHMTFMFVGIYPILYVIAEFIQLIGYAGLLSAFIMVLRHGKKKKQN